MIGTPTGWRDLAVLTIVFLVFAAGVLGSGLLNAWWQGHPQRHAHREWERHVRGAIRMGNANAGSRAPYRVIRTRKEGLGATVRRLM